jgi:4-amino-4-deoxy-L-arabinose transferase-like glycosyltransferase
MRLGEQTPRARDALVLWLLALAVRGAIASWAAARFPAAEDGRYYHTLATRLSDGLGYTWLWPDGAVTFAAHYPVGYPALISGAYALLGASPASAMIVNALIGSAAAPAAYAVTGEVSPRAGALLGGVLVALSPALVFYTPAVMTEGVTAALIVIAAWLSLLARRRGPIFLLLLGILLGLAALVRPPTLLLAPIFGLYAARGLAPGWRKRALSALATTTIALATIAPWTARNCLRMDRCVLVSANGGWNLLIGTSPEADGSFAPIEDELVPEACRSVFGEAAKDACFGRAALASVRRAPLAWLGRVPRKLAHTFGSGGAPGWYLSVSNPDAFSPRARLVLGGAEAIWQRGAALLAVAALARMEGPRARARRVLAVISALSLLTPAAWIGYLGMIATGLLSGRALLAHLPALTAVGTVAATALAHAIFFGAGRYSLVCYAAVGMLAGAAVRRGDRPFAGVLTAIGAARDTARGGSGCP